MPALPVVSNNDKEWVNRVGLSRKHIFDAVDDSVRRLGTYIDVLQIHRLDRNVPREEIMRALNDVVESGKVRYIGASSVSCWFSFFLSSSPFFRIIDSSDMDDELQADKTSPNPTDGSLGIPNPPKHRSP